jgi:carbon monoxide dehydrogenase subunit G
MASIRKEFIVEAPVSSVWDAIRDVGAVHRRLARNFVVDTTLEEGARVVKFANGFVARELIVDVDDQQRRIAYAVVGGAATHHHATMQVSPEGEQRTRFVWITDVVPDSLKEQFGGMIDMGAEAMRKTLEGRA